MITTRRLLFAQTCAAALVGADAFLRGASAETVTYAYDALGRVRRANYASGRVIFYAYDAAGNRSAIDQAQTPAFAALPASINVGSSSSLNWAGGDATSASIDQGIGTVTPAGGFLLVSPTTTTTYTLSLNGPSGPITKQATVTVTAAAPTGSFVADPTSISLGGSATLSWTSTGATTASIDNGVGSVTPVAGGSLSVSPATTTTYTLTLTGPGGVLTKQATVTVTAVPPTGTFAATLPSIFPGGSATLSWTSSGATSASIDNGVGSVTPVAGGSVSVSPSATTTYTLTLTGPGGIVTRQVTVSVDPGFNQTIAITGSGPVNLRTLASTAGYNGQQNANVTFTLGSGVTITGTPGELADGGPGIDSGGWPNELNTIVIALQIDGTVYGGGGGGGDGTQGSLGGAGGDAIYCRLPLSITVNSGGVVRAGGGGGKGGVTSPPPLERWGGGGGGGGAPNGLGGTGGTGTTSDGQPGSPGTVSGGGAGGAPAGAGATAGSAGGAFATSGGGGSAAGYAIRKNGFTVPVTNNGTITGTVG